ncbi:dihydroneopterin aldolase [Rathayibacter toxicus]|uniref:7,8-dihydroneopterin aldolase n=1 Tax=Rathayibacter toxicus TaxID=145458 RepID=A0A2S5Y4L1_9MICO|nr:dihydroneopterin aldolase [Rathayibacter toxicus]PPG20843.1 dihydroneopterin aldolase [Rathayibacter toxicus]PPG45946.1 dihydroneopterin aldolase [Rathayibacter toxicus]PPH21204.1 dihydroneopterin aldolase [Rathayibacter toxicus]PPH56319.1 dihydroneopterin aldolase [Rathayibacter toxicus]PPH58415.1 dihydroneopterin aldolase [Rathayibacter toxicus]
MTRRPVSVTSAAVALRDSLTLTGLRVRAHHGVFDFERENGQDFVIDATVWLDTTTAAEGDTLAETVHYGELAVALADAVARDPVDLIETLAERLAAVALGFAAVEVVRITVHKPDAPIPLPCADVAVQITRTRP